MAKNNPGDIVPGFNRPRKPGDRYTADEYKRLGLGKEPSLAQIEPHAVQMMRDGQVVEGIGLVLGREVSSKELQRDRNLGDIALLAALGQPEQAFGILLMHMAAREAE